MDDFLEYKEFDGIKIYYLKNDRCIGRILSQEKIWEPWMHAFIKHFYIKNTDIIDIGANVGAITFQQMIKIIDKPNNIYCFEPFFGDIIEKTIKENNLENVKIYKYALSDCNKHLKLPIIDYGINTNFGGCNVLNASIDETNVNYNCYKLDHFNLSNVSLIKIDVEGHEIEVLRGMCGTLKNNDFPTLLLEIWSFSRGWVKDCIQNRHKIGIDIVCKFVETYTFLEDLGYIMFHIAGDDFLFVHKNKKELLSTFIINN